VIKIVSGAQTGVDRGALNAALAEGVECGGWCPEGRKAEDGVIPERYPVTELSGSGYRQRTLKNVVDSDGTLIIYFGTLSGGTELTLIFCSKQQRPYLLIDASEITPQRAAERIAKFIDSNRIRTLNVAGPRASSTPDAEHYTVTTITTLLHNLPD